MHIYIILLLKSKYIILSLTLENSILTRVQKLTIEMNSDI